MTCINGNGEAVGFGTTDSGERGFLWSSGTITEILPSGGDSARVTWINDGGEIAGTWEKDGVRHAFLLRGTTFLDPTPNWGESEANYVGEDGAVAGRGEYGVYVSRDGITEIFPGFSSVVGGNSSGQWVGSSGTFSVLFFPGRWRSTTSTKWLAMGIPRLAGAVSSGPAEPPRRSYSPGGHPPKRLP